MVPDPITITFCKKVPDPISLIGGQYIPLEPGELLRNPSR